jgi:hypothetical protein
MHHGGKQHLGWAIWEWPKVLIEAEFHCIWESPGGELLDITPKDSPLDKILFLPDPKRKYGGVQVDNIRKALARDKNIERFISLAHERYVELNRIVKPDYYGPIIYSAKATAIDDEMKELEYRFRIKYGAPGTTD